MSMRKLLTDFKLNQISIMTFGGIFCCPANVILVIGWNYSGTITYQDQSIDTATYISTYTYLDCPASSGALSLAGGTPLRGGAQKLGAYYAKGGDVRR